MSTSGRLRAGSTLLAALLLQATAPHFHGAPSGVAGERTVEARTGTASNAGAIASPECLACRTSQQLRLGIVGPTASGLPTKSDVVARTHDDVRVAAFEFLLDLAPPRAPPA